ncbi:tyrosine-type recombinase/integrase [Saccharopolyspora spinosa]|uniref:Integrase n=1 Tax=Saccharopolyspora spinosa TaxID=60894 RepID=A0A2N3Y773_SACSN|nr:tyrosine-type recombinase/integrase [Saccharopolyspora spinosa]PKW18789.1 integrase [Saccharopolyspora spinosa]
MSFVEKSGKNTWRVRYWKDDGTHGSIPGFATKKAAENKANEIDSERRHGTFLDPNAGRLLLADWATTWLDSLDVEQATESQYTSLIRNHILPRWGTTSLSDITGSAVHGWSKKLRAKGYAHSTVTTIVKILSMMLADATHERLIPANPIRPQRRGKRRRAHRREALWAAPDQVLKIALQAAVAAWPGAGTLMITAAYTGARWGELAGLQRFNTHLDDGCIVIDPDIGALHEVDGALTLGPPKTEDSARTISLPPFLIEMLRAHLDTHCHSHVFVTKDNELLRRSNFSRRAMRPTTDGTLHKPRARHHLQPIVPGLVFHGFRHSHKTWLIADGIPQVAQARRLGHVIPDKIEHIYSHVAPEIETRLLQALQQRWTTALTTLLDQRSSHDAAATTVEIGLNALPAVEAA